MKGETQALSERPLEEILRDERSLEFAGKGKEEASRKKPRWRDPEPPIIERPFRARKAIQRFGSGPEAETPKEVHILKGSGMALKDIPNVAHKLAKVSRTEDILILFHTLLYGKRAKVNHLKPNISNFSGYVWTENKEKEQKKVKERLERFTKEGLHQLIDLLDLQISKTSSKKEELAEEVYNFLLAPKSTRKSSTEKPEKKSKEELLKVKESQDKRNKVPKKGGQKKVPKGKDAARRKGKAKPSQSVAAKAGGKRSVKRRKPQEEETGEELKKPFKKFKESRDADFPKEEQKDEVIRDEALLKEEKERKEQKTYDMEQEAGGRGDAENVAMEYTPEEEKAEQADGEAPKAETEEKGNGAILDSSLLEKEVPEDVKDVPQESLIISEKDGGLIDESNLTLKSEEHLGGSGADSSLEKDQTPEEGSFAQFSQEAYQGDVLGSSEEKVTAEVVEPSDNGKAPDGEDISCFILEHEAQDSAGDKPNNNLPEAPTADPVNMLEANVLDDRKDEQGET